jgi:hypothetical protein
MFKRMSAACALALGIMGCFDFGGGPGCTPGGNGLTGNGDFTYSCISEADPQCERPLTTAPLPTQLARRAQFGLSFGGGVVTPVSPRAVQSNVGTFQALRTGKIGFVVLKGDELIDAVRFDVVEPDGLRVVPPGEGSVKARAIATSRGRDVAGAMAAVAWSIVPSDLATVESNGDGTCEVHRLRAGRGTIVGELEALRGEAPIEIADDDPVDASADATDGGDAGGDS